MTEQPITLLLPGQGSQHTGMALDTYRHQPEFAATIDEFLTLMSEEGASPSGAGFLMTPRPISMTDGSRSP